MYLSLMLMCRIQGRHCLIASETSMFNGYVHRWGQAYTTTSNKLIIHGGKVDPQNKYSYYSAPNTDELISLDLTSSFPVANPPWQLLAGGYLSKSPVGSPRIAFHTLTAFNDQNLLGFRRRVHKQP